MKTYTIKPLEWEPHANGWIAFSPFGEYELDRDPNKTNRFYVTGAAGLDLVKRCEHAAKAACEQDYRDRMIQGLTEQPNG